MFKRSTHLYDRIYAWKDYPAEAARVHGIVQRYAPGARTLLDVACGTGKHLELLRTWYQVAGTDLDPAMLEIARRRNPDVPLHQADMADLSLGRRFDAVVCLFSSIGYVRTVERLGQAVAAMGRHVERGGALLVEPWFTLEEFRPKHVFALFVDDPELKIARVNAHGTVEDGRVSVFDFHYLVGTPSAVEHFTERHEMGLFTHDQYLEAFRAAGLEVHHHPQGLEGRGLYVGLRPR